MRWARERRRWAGITRVPCWAIIARTPFLAAGFFFCDFRAPETEATWRRHVASARDPIATCAVGLLANHYHLLVSHVPSLLFVLSLSWSSAWACWRASMSNLCMAESRSRWPWKYSVAISLILADHFGFRML